MKSFTNKTQKEKRVIRSRSKIFGTQERPRLSVFRSNNNIYAQLINDQNGTTLGNASAKMIKDVKKMTKTDKARLVGEKIAGIAQEKNIKEAVFDRSGYQYHGAIKALAEGAREKGLKF